MSVNIEQNLDFAGLHDFKLQIKWHCTTDRNIEVEMTHSPFDATPVH